jgi:hypothetical protein
MLLSTAVAFLVASVLGAALSAVLLNDRRISDDVYQDLVHYFKYASSAYSQNFTIPNGYTLVKEVCSSTLINCKVADSERPHNSSRPLARIHKGSSHGMTIAMR